MAVVGLLMAAALGEWAAALPWTLLVLGLDGLATVLLVGSTTRSARLEASVALVAAAALAGVAFGLTGFATFLLLPLVAYHCGLLMGRRAILYACAAAAVTDTAVVLLRHGADRLGRGFEPSWILAGTVFALLGAWSLQLSRSNERLDRARAHEASSLLRRLEEVTGPLATGLDAPALGDAALRELRAGLDCQRAALIAVHDGWPVPVAIAGATRFPWREPTRADSALNASWTTARSTRSRFADGTRTVELVCVPLLSAGEGLVGLLVADRSGTGFTDPEAAFVESLADKWAPLLGASLLFARLRLGAALEERNRLAREMHDGVAQELAALAYRGDAVAMLVARGDARAQEAADALREELREVVKGVRSHISDLRMLERPDRSLGAILGLLMQGLSATTDLRTELALHETGMRFPADVELQLHHLVEHLLADARVARGATRVTVDVTLESPNALIRVEHDGATRVSADALAKLAVPGGMAVTMEDGPGLAVRIATVWAEASTDPEEKGAAHDLSRARR